MRRGCRRLSVQLPNRTPKRSEKFLHILLLESGSPLDHAVDLPFHVDGQTAVRQEQLPNVNLKRLGELSNGVK
jgi:hypothetical protein